MAVKRLSPRGRASGSIPLVNLRRVKALFAGSPLPQSKGTGARRHRLALAASPVPATRKRPAAVRPAMQRSLPAQSKGPGTRRRSQSSAQAAVPEVRKRPSARPAGQRAKKAGKQTKPLTRKLRKKRIRRRRLWNWRPKPRKRQLRRRRAIRQRMRAPRPSSRRLRVVGGQAPWLAPAPMAAAPAPLVVPAAAPQPLPEHAPAPEHAPELAPAPAPDPAPPAPPVQPEGVPGDLYHSVFAFDIPTPQIQVDPAVWDNVRESVPNQYLIPDAAFLNVLAGEEIVPLVDAPTLDADTLAELASEVTEPTIPEAAPDGADAQDPHGE